MKKGLEEIDLLRRISMFSKLSDKELKRLLFASVERYFLQGEVIVEQGNAGVGLFIIKQGNVRIYKTLPDGTEVDIASHGAGGYLGEMSVLDGAERVASAAAKSDVTCLVLATWSLKAVLERDPRIALKMLPILVEKYRETNNELVKLKIGSNHFA